MIRRLFLSRELKRTENFVKTFHESNFSDQLGEGFREAFFIPNLEEAYFEARTGIQLSSKNIKKLIEFRDKYLEDYSWRDIRRMMPFIKFNKKAAKFTISKGMNTIFLIYNLLGVAFLIFGMIYPFFSPPESFTTNIERVLILVTSIGFVTIGCFLILIVFKVWGAKRIARKIARKSA